jgi:hypothetical protein
MRGVCFAVDVDAGLSTSGPSQLVLVIVHDHVTIQLVSISEQCLVTDILLARCRQGQRRGGLDFNGPIRSGATHFPVPFCAQEFRRTLQYYLLSF